MFLKSMPLDVVVMMPSLLDRNASCSVEGKEGRGKKGDGLGLGRG